MTSLVTEHRLPIRPIPHHGESLRGYLLRLSTENGYASPLWLRKLEPCLKRITDEQAVVEAITRLTGLSSIQSKLRSPFGSSKSMARFRAIRPRICPECVREFGYQDAVWEIAFACACPYHNILLVDACPECRAPLSWDRNSLNFCGCGAAFAKGEPIKSGTPLLYLNTMIWAAAGRKVPLVELPGFPNEALSSLSLEQLCRFYWFLSSYGNGRKPLNRNRPAKVDSAIDELDAVSSLLAEWPLGIHRLLDNRRDESGKFVGEGLQQAFGKLYCDLYEKFTDEKFSFVRESFEEFIRTSWNGIVDGKYRRITQDKGRNDFISISKAGKILGISSKRLKKFVRLGLVKGTSTIRLSGRQHTVISESDVRRFSNDVCHMVNRSEVLMLLGISRQQFQVLLEEGLIKPLIRSGENGFCEWWFDARQIEKFLTDILSIVPGREPDTNSIPFTVVFQRHLKSVKLLPRFLEAVQKGTVSVEGIKENGKLNLASLHFSKDSISKFRAGIKQKKEGVYSIPNVAIRLGLKQEVAYHLVHTGLLDSEFDPSSKRAGRIVTDHDINAFETTYVPLVQLARFHGTSVRTLKKKFENLGIFQVTGHPVDGCRQIFYRRSDVCKTEFNVNLSETFFNTPL